jgi:far upstream element-binding protein
MPRVLWMMTKCFFPCAVVETETISVPNDLIGLIIGKRGANIKEYELRSGAKIKVASNEEWAGREDPRPITIEGKKSQREYAKNLIYEILDTAGAGEGVIPEGWKPLPKTGAAGKSNELTIQVQNDHVGLIIGKAGQTIKQLEMLTGVRIHIAKECPAGSTKRPITLVGFPQKVTFAKAHIEGKVRYELFLSLVCVPTHAPKNNPRLHHKFQPCFLTLMPMT